MVTTLAIVAIAIFLAALLLGLPVAIAIGFGVLFYLFWTDIPLILIAVRATSNLSSIALIAVPLFIFAALLMMESGITRRLVNFCMSLIGWLRGGLALVNVLIGVIFGGVSGAALSEAASIGSWMIPTMKQRGYTAEYAAAVTAAASTISPILPPSIVIIVAASVAELSVIDLFIGAIVPGVLMGVFLMITAYGIAVYKGHPREGGFSLATVWHSFRSALLDLVMPILIIGGVRFGWYTATEGAAVAVAYALLLGAVVYRELSFEKLVTAAIETAVITGAVLLLVALASTMSWIITIERIPQSIVAGVAGLDMSSWVLVLVLVVWLLIVGMFMDGLAATILFLPVLLPLAPLLDMHPYQITLFVVMAMVLGVLTPPIGVCLFITASIAKVSFLRVAYTVLPFIAALLLVLLLVAFVPWITLGFLS